MLKNRLKSWILTDLPPNRKVIWGKLVYKIKQSTNQEPIYKARWVVKGFQQLPGVDFTDTFANTLNPIGFRLLMAIAAFHDYYIRQWDVKNAYPNAEVHEEIYTQQPIGFEVPNHVCLVKKALNGLKQSTREW